MRCGYKTGLTLDFLHSVRVKSGPDQVRGLNENPLLYRRLYQRLFLWSRS
ncbi:MAG: hypothetical protein QG603_104 [Patescibacteria group bacterium]|nr:hypothetical protein [Patescibacteria group bacterium]